MRSSNTRIKIALVIALVIAAGFVGWWVGHTNKSTDKTGDNNSQNSTSDNVAGTSAKSLVSYTLPDGWSESTCTNSNDVIHVVPNGATLDCSANPSAPIKIFVDSQNRVDCQQLAPPTNDGIKKHICISLYISGLRSLKASTEYSNGSGYSTDTTISGYYIDTGKGVVAVQYTFTSANNYQAGFDQLANSIKATD